MTNDEKKTLLQQRYAELDDENLCALERYKLTEQARELFDAELARRGLDLAAYEARHGDSLYRSRTALRRRSTSSQAKRWPKGWRRVTGPWPSW